jgi:hypothetical protein
MPPTTTHPSSVPFSHVVDMGTSTAVVHMGAAEVELCIEVADRKGAVEEHRTEVARHKAAVEEEGHHTSSGVGE